MYIERVPNRNSPAAILLRESYRQDGKVRKRTLANLSDWSPELVEQFQQLLRGARTIDKLEETFEITRSRPHGHVAAVLGTLRRLKLETAIVKRRGLNRDLVVAMVVSRLLEPASKLATARSLNPETSLSSLAEELQIESVTETDLYQAMDWLLQRQSKIEQQLAKRHLSEGTLVLCDLSSTYFEGEHCSLATRGYSRDQKRGTLQIVFGLLCNAQGCPVAVEVFSGNTTDSTTLKPQLQKLTERFGINEGVLVGDRGMIPECRIQKEFKNLDGWDWVTALRAVHIRQLLESGELSLEQFNDQNWVEIQSTKFPDERLIACRNPQLADLRAHHREDLLQATERELDEIVAATSRDREPLQGKDAIGVRLGKVINRFRMAKHFCWEITDTSFSYKRNAQGITAEGKLDGLYVIRTSVAAKTLSAEDAVRAYKSLSQVEQAFRCFKSTDLKVRPIFHRLENRVKAHVLICLLAYYVEWHMRQSLAPMLFDEDDPLAAAQLRRSVVDTAHKSGSARQKAASKRTQQGLPVHSFQSLLADLATVVRSTIQPKQLGVASFEKVTQPTPVQNRAFELLKVQL